MGIRSLSAAAAMLCCAATVFAAAPVESVHVDLNPLIDSAFQSKEQFAVNIPRAISSSKEGSWSQRGAVSTWTYSVRIPTAVSMSFHATSAALPPSAILTVAGAKTTSSYSAHDIHRNGIWGRPSPGDTINFSLSVNSREADLVRFEVNSLQAGYRGLGDGVADHPHFTELKKTAGASPDCTENFVCHVSPDTQGPSHATVAVVVGNLYQCTGTLLNNSRNDGTPYVLTARHCENGQLGGGNPDAAATVTVYWDAVSACGPALGSIYEGGTTQFGATTALEQQDLWLIQLDTPPAASDAYFAGWDVSGTPFSGGYSIHHSLGGTQQFVQWAGTDVLEQIPGSTFSITYDSTFWGTVNGLGNIGAGGSGSALFSPNNLVVGSASLADLTGGQNTAGTCPAPTPPAPSANTATTLFTALSGVWTSTADRSSSTNNKTLQALLDPGSTGVTQLTGIATQPITLTSSVPTANAGAQITLSWNAAGATTCTASGGSSGDGWNGSRPASGTLKISNFTGGPVTYALNCLTGNQIGAGSVTVLWNFVAPQIGLSSGAVAPFMLGALNGISWSPNVAPCVGSGGVPGDGWSGPQANSGQFFLHVTQPGLTSYTLTCGTAPRTATETVVIGGVDPNTILMSSASKVPVGYRFNLDWFGYGTGGNCNASGGSANDTWANNGNNGSVGSTDITEPVAGTFTYTMTCTGGGQTASSSQTVVVTNDPPAISISPVSPQQQIYPTANPATILLNMYWTSNINSCTLDWTSNSGQQHSDVLSGESLNGVVGVTESAPGLVTYTMTCGTQLATTTINWVTTATPSALTAASNAWVANIANPLTWNSATGSCVGSGGAPGDGWAGPKSQSGSQSVAEAQPGFYKFTLTCGSATSNVLVGVPAPLFSIYPQLVDPPNSGIPYTTIVWSSTVGPCTYLDGSVSSSTPVAVPPAGTRTPSPATSGTYLFTLSCGSGANIFRTAQLVPITLTTPTTLSASATTVAVDTPVTLTWKSATGVCDASGGDSTLPWFGEFSAAAGSLVVTSPSVGSLTYGITCNGQSAQVTVNYTAVPSTSAGATTPQVTISSSAATQTVGASISLTWKATNAASCSAGGGSAGDGWTGNLASSGSMAITEMNAGTITYSITCAGAPPAATASTSVTIKAAGAASSSGGSSHGGGAVDLRLVLLLSALLAARWYALRTRG
jgi:hypothetical protein